jgi:hypothetical protein
MGYYTSITDSVLLVKQEDFDKVYQKMCELNDYHDLKRGGSFGSNNDNVEGERYPRDKWFSWMDYNYPETCKDLSMILGQIGFDVQYNEDGDLVGLSYYNKTGNEDYFLSCFAGFTPSGSFIEFKGESDDDYYRFLFNENAMIKQQAEVIIKYDGGEFYEFGKLSEADESSKKWREHWAKTLEEKKINGDDLKLENI